MNRLAPVLAAAFLCAAPARALLVLEQGRAQLNVMTAVDVAWDSNVFSNSTEASDLYTTARLALEYERKAALIGIRADAEWAYSRFEDFSEQNTVQPSLKVILDKKRGRLVGNARLVWRKANEADNEANTRTRFTESSGDFTLKYPINHRFSVSGTTSYEDRRFADGALYDRSIFSQGIDVFRVYSSKLDLFAGYRVRTTDLAAAPGSTDHALTVGATGKLLPRLDGTVRTGWQWRRVEGAGTLPAWTAAAAAIWTPRNNISVELRATRDFSVTSTAFTTDGLSFSLESRYTTPRKLGLTAGAGWVDTDFFLLATETRADEHVYLRFGADYPITPRIKATASVVFERNWSTFAFADYDRRLFNLGITARF